MEEIKPAFIHHKPSPRLKVGIVRDQRDGEEEGGQGLEVLAGCGQVDRWVGIAKKVSYMCQGRIGRTMEYLVRI